jgi:hypothetical protein
MDQLHGTSWPKRPVRGCDLSQGVQSIPRQIRVFSEDLFYDYVTRDDGAEKKFLQGIF